MKKERITIGCIGFKGPVKNDAVEIGYGIFEDFEGRGYTTEAAIAAVEWAFMNENVFFVEAEAEKELTP